MRPSKDNLPSGFIVLSLLVLLIGTSGVARAQVVSPVGPPAGATGASAPRPTAGSLLPTVSAERPSTGPASSIEERLGRSPPIADVEGLKIDVDDYKLVGLSAASPAEFSTVLKAYTGPAKRFQDILDAAASVRAGLVSRGYFLADVLVPTQRIQDGVVELLVLEGRLGKTQIQVAKETGVSEAFVRSHLAGLASGTLLTAGTVERAIFLLQDLRGLKIDYSFGPGEAVGTADLTINVKPGPRLGGNVEGDNYGSAYTGVARLGIGAEVANVFGRGDLLNVRVLTSLDYNVRRWVTQEGLQFGRVSYLLPLNGLGTKLGLAYSALDYALGREFAPLRAEGDATVGSVIVLHPFVRSRNLNLIGSLQWDDRQFADRQGAIGIQAKNKTRVAAIALGGDVRDDILRGGTTTFSASITEGKLSFGDVNDELADAGTLRASGRYRKYNIGVTRLQRFVGTSTIYLSYAQQIAGKNLYTSEKFSLGGPNGVRAYPQGELVSDEGYIATVELRVPLSLPPVGKRSQGAVLVAFTDYAESKFLKEPYQPTAVNTGRIAGSGLGVNWGLGDDWALRSSVAWRYSGRATSETADRRPRVYIQLSRQF